MGLRRSFVRASVLVSILLVAAACSPQGQAPPPPQPAASATPTAAPLSELVTEGASATEGPDPTAEPTREPVQTSTTEELPLGSPDLKASDPTTVRLAAGQPQLLEFFAFW